jgi:TnpA family transposase
MSRTESREAPELLLPARAHRPVLVLPEDPSDDELLRHWTLSEVDTREILRCRGDDNRWRFALQLCALRIFGRFVPNHMAVPVRILNYLGRQLDLPPTLFLPPPHREATDLEQEQRIRAYLHVQPFDATARERLTQWLTHRAQDGLTPQDLYQHAEAQLREWQVLLPGPSTLERLIGTICAQTHHGLFERLASRLSPEMQHAFDAFLQARPGETQSPLATLQQYPPEATATALKTYIDRYHLVRDLRLAQLDLSDIRSGIIEHLARLTRRYDVRALRRFPAPRRYALVLCFLVEVEKTLLDYVVAMHDQLLTIKCREARHVYEERLRTLRRRVRPGVATLIATGQCLLHPERSPDTTLAALFREAIDAKALQQAIEDCQAYQRLEERGYVDALHARYPPLRRYLPAFYTLPFVGEPGTASLQTSLQLVTQLDTGVRQTLPEEAPTDFVPTAWWPALRQPDGTFDRRTWELALALGVRDALRAGSLYLPTSRRHVSFWKLVYDDAQWAQAQPQAYAELSMPQAVEQALGDLRQTFDTVAQQAAVGLPTNPFVRLQNTRLRPKRDDALEIPPRVKELRRVIETHLPRIRIEELLMTVDRWCGFTRAFTALSDAPPRRPLPSPALLAALIAHGTNLGVVAMGNSAIGVSVAMLEYLSSWFLREDTLKAANAILVNYHHSLELSSVWGHGLTSSSDGQRFALHADSLMGSLCPRYFGYYDRAVTVYTHLSDQWSVYGTRIIACAAREALYVLDGLLENDTVLRPKTHYTDTHGFSEQLFGLCYLLGFQFMPRIKDLKDQQLYKVSRMTSYGPLDPVFRATVDLGLIAEQWDQLVRIAASLRHRTAPADVVLKRLAGGAPSDRLAKALTALGRVLKTIHLLRYVQDTDLRHQIQRQLNRGEFRHKLARRLFFANQGAFQTGDYEEMMNKASCLSLLCNAVLVWNTVHMSRIIEQLRATGVMITDEEVALISPLAYAHVIPNGTYFFDRVGEGEAVSTEQKLLK